MTEKTRLQQLIDEAGQSVPLKEIVSAFSRRLGGADGIVTEAIHCMNSAPDGGAVRAGLVKVILELFVESAKQDNNRSKEDCSTKTEEELLELAKYFSAATDQSGQQAHAANAVAPPVTGQTAAEQKKPDDAPANGDVGRP